MGFEIKGLDELEKQFNNMEREINELANTKEIPLSALFNSRFMTTYTSYSSFDDLLEAGNFHMESEEDFESIPEDEFDLHISNSTVFPNWEEMLGKAYEIYIENKLSF